MTELRDIQKRALGQIRPTGITALGLTPDGTNARRQRNVARDMAGCLANLRRTPTCFAWWRRAKAIDRAGWHAYPCTSMSNSRAATYG